MARQRNLKARYIIRILFAGDLLPNRKGAARSSSELLVALAARGHEIVAVAPITAATPDWPSFDRAAHPGVAVTRFEVPYYDSFSRPAPAAYRRDLRKEIVQNLRDLLSARPFEVVVVGKESFVPGVPALVHGVGLVCAVISHGSILSLTRPDYPQDIAAAILAELRQADMTVACAAHLARGLEALGLSNVYCVPNAIDTERFRPGRQKSSLTSLHSIPNDAIVVGHVSTLHPVKRTMDLIHSAAAAVRREPRLVFLFVGGGDAGRHEAMRSAVEEHGIGAHVRFAGWQDYERVPDYMRLADMVVYPSESEGLCRGYLEAMACARLVIASDIPAAREVIDDGKTGLLFRKGDIAALTERILEAAADGRLRRRIGRNARRHVRRRYDFAQWPLAYEAALSTPLPRDAD